MGVLGGSGAVAEPPAPLSALAKMPVKEITVFKDGHAFVLHQGDMPTDRSGNVQMDYLPTPVLGTFWPYSSDKNVKLSSVTASVRKVLVERTTLTIPDLMTANPGTEVTIFLNDGKTSLSGKIVESLTRSSEEAEKNSPPNSGEKLPERSNLILLKNEQGTHVVALDQIRNVSLIGAYKKQLAQEEFRNLLSLKLDWQGKEPAKTAAVGMVYLQKGVRWIPSYKMSIDGKGGVHVKLQASIINELTDLQDVTANLVIGVPSFAFKDTPDPISLQQAFAQVSTYFDANSQSSYALSNGIMSQSGGFGGGGRFSETARATNRPDTEPGPEVGDSKNNEDLFVFNVKHITLKKGQRMTIPVAEYDLKYKDVYKLDISFAPPREVRGNFNTQQQSELAKALASPKAIHVIRILNSGKLPITTAPVLLLNEDKILAQSSTNYASVGNSLDITLTTATDIKVKKTESESLRTPNAENWNGHQYTKVDLNGKLSLTNFKDREVEVEVTRNVLGKAVKADHEGEIIGVNSLEDDEYSTLGDNPSWWGWYSWPYWWSHFNGVSRLKWNVKLAPGKSVDLSYQWNYYWE